MLKNAMLLLGLGVLLLTVYAAGPSNLVSAIASANPTLLLAGFFLVVLMILLNAYRFYVLAKSLARVSFKECFSVVCFSQVLNQGVVALLGDVSKALLLKKFRGIPLSKTTGVIVVERTQDIAFAFLLSLFLLYKLPFLANYFLAIALVVAAAALLLRYFPKIDAPLVASATKFFSELKRAVKSFSGKTVAYSVLITAVTFAVTGAINQAILSSLGYNLGFFTVLTVNAASLLVGALSGMPGGIGSREAVLLLLYGQYSVPASVAVAASLIARVFFVGASYVFYWITSR